MAALERNDVAESERIDKYEYITASLLWVLNAPLLMVWYIYGFRNPDMGRVDDFTAGCIVSELERGVCT